MHRTINQKYYEVCKQDINIGQRWGTLKMDVKKRDMLQGRAFVLLGITLNPGWWVNVAYIMYEELTVIIRLDGIFCSSIYCLFKEVLMKEMLYCCCSLSATYWQRVKIEFLAVSKLLNPLLLYFFLLWKCICYMYVAPLFRLLLKCSGCL